MRETLPNGTIVTLRGKDYRIETVIGEGGSCIVYDASAENEFGTIRKYRLKECYPYNASCHREGNELIWDDAMKRITGFERFRKSVTVLSTLRDEESLGNYFTESEPYEANGTLYAVMPVNHAKTYDKDYSMNLHQILQTILKLTRITAKLHSYGYLHLDIKPENFLVEYDPDPNIWLFDVDSLIPISDLQNGRASFYSYSREWAAPELVQGKLRRVCYATDLYSIGAILFSKVMGRPVSNDDIGMFPEWNFDGEIFDEVNPKIKRILSEIFANTISASTSRRYKTADLMVNALERACDVAREGQPFLISPELQIPAHFTGRETELDIIHQAFSKGKKVLFLHGVGGIGKTTLATAYAVRYRKIYDSILFCRYKDSLEDVLDDIEICNFDGTDSEKRRLLKRLLDKNVLFIVDNFDVSTDADPFLWQLLKFKANIIFTTRTDFSNVLTHGMEQVEIPVLPYEQLKHLFAKISNVQIATPQQECTFRQMLKSIEYHTYVTELLSRQIVASGWTLETLARKMSEGLGGLAAAEKVQALKDDMAPKRTIPEGLRVLFDMAALDGRSRLVLRNLYLLCGFLGVTKDSYKLFCNSQIFDGGSKNEDGSYRSYYFYPVPPQSSPDINVLNELYELGWVQKIQSVYVLHPLVAELIKEDLKPCRAYCLKLYEYIDSVLLCFKCYHEHDEADEVEQRNRFELLTEFLNHIDFADNANREMALSFLDAVGTVLPHLMNLAECRSIVSKLLREGSRGEMSAEQLCDLYFRLFDISLMCYSDDGSDNKDQRVRDFYDLALNSTEHLKFNERDLAVERIYDAIKWMMVNERSLLPKDFGNHICRVRPEMIEELSPYLREHYNIPLTELDQKHIQDENKELGQYFANKSNAGNEDEDYLERWEKRINDLHNAFRQSTDKRAFAQNLCVVEGLTIYQAVACLLEFCQNVFHYIAHSWHDYSDPKVLRYISNFDWNGIVVAMDYAEEVQASAQWQKEYNGYSLYDDQFFAHRDTGEPSISSICRTDLWKVELAAIQCEWQKFDSLLTRGETLPFDYPMIHKGMEPLNHVAQACWNIGKCRFVLPHLIRDLEEKETGDDFYERDHLYEYENVVAYAQKACLEVDEGSEDLRKFKEISESYQQRIDRITGKNYTLKKDISSTSE